MLFSLIIPVCNEKDLLEELISRTVTVLEAQDCQWEIVMVDDGSDDGSVAILRDHEVRTKNFVFVELIRNYGQTIALRAGIEASKGDVIICMDGDLQHKPEELPQFIKQINEGYDLVSGYKDEQSKQSFSSKLAHSFVRMISGFQLKYFGATFKAFRREILDTRVMVGNAHRYLGIFLARNTRNIKEIPIKIEPRNSGRSKYNNRKIFSVLVELVSLKFTSNEVSKSSAVYKKAGLTLAFICALVDFFLIILDLFSGVNIKEAFIIEFIFTNFVLTIGLLFFLFGVLFELNMHIADTQVYIARKK